MFKENICPVCNNDSLEEGEYVDVGFGINCGVKCSPDHCYFCEYIEPSIHNTFDLPISHFEKCWELQVYPHPPIPKSEKGTVEEKYLPFFEKEYEKAYGNCYKQCMKLAEVFPNLKIIQGTVLDICWGERDHFWCVDENNIIIDPTKIQFPGLFEYCPKRTWDLDSLRSVLNAN